MDLILGISIGVIIMLIFIILVWHFSITPKLNTVEKLNNDIIKKNEELQESNSLYEIKNKELQNEFIEIKNNVDNGKHQLELTLSEYNTISKNLQEQKEVVDSAASDYRNAEFQKIDFQIKEKKQEYDDIISNCQNNYIDAEREYHEEYSTLMQDYVKAFSEKSLEINNQKESLLAELNDLRARVNALVDEARRRQEEEDSENFYKLQLSEQDLDEIKRLKEIIPYLRNAEPLNKIIWKTYYEKPTTDMIGRVVGSKTVTGIYKITNLLNGMCYVGQSVDIATRFKQHIKRGLGAEAPTRNKLYPAMASFGVENFRFEILEECSKELLDSREDYYQEVFQAKVFGYSIT